MDDDELGMTEDQFDEAFAAGTPVEAVAAVRPPIRFWSVQVHEGGAAVASGMLRGSHVYSQGKAISAGNYCP